MLFLLTKQPPTCWTALQNARGRIIVPYEQNRMLYGGYALGDANVENFLLKHAHDHRILFETEGRFV